MTLHWRFDAGNPVIRPGQLNGALDAHGTATGQVIQVGDRYRMYYWGRGDDGVNRICIAEAPVDHPNQWAGRGAVLGPQPETAYNCNGPVIPAVLPRDDGPWLMVMGTNAQRRGSEMFWWYTGLAQSEDEGLTWRYITTEPLIAPDRWYDALGTGTAFILREGELYHMYYTAGAAYDEIGKPIVGIAYAESRDGLHWTKPLNDWVVAPRRNSVSPVERWVAKPCVVREGNGYRMWVSAAGDDYRVYSLTSSDGIAWAWDDYDPRLGALGIGAPGSFDDTKRSYATVTRADNEYRLWYSGNGYGATGMGYATAAVDIG